MTTLPAAPKLGKLIALLATNQQGERLAAVDAIGRTLVAAGLDFHDLARAVDGVEIHPSASVGTPVIDAPSRWDGLTHFDRVAWLETIRGCDWLTPREREFVTELATEVRCAHRWLKGHETRKVNKLIAIATAKGVRL